MFSIQMNLELKGSNSQKKIQNLVVSTLKTYKLKKGVAPIFPITPDLAKSNPDLIM